MKSIRLYDNLSSEEQALAPEKKKFVVKTTPSNYNVEREADTEDNIQVLSFDYIVICSGQYSKPHIPTIKGLEKFKGKVLAAKDFRDPERDYFYNIESSCFRRRIFCLRYGYTVF